MYKDFVNVTPESGGAGTTPIAVAADENEGAAARSTSLNIAGGGVTRTVSITQKKMLVENQIEVKYWLDAATSMAGKSIYLEAYANNDVASNLKINFSIDQQGPTGEWETSTPVEILINTGDNASTTYEIPYYDYGWRFHEEVATITPSQDEDFIYYFAGFIEEFRAPEIGIWKINTLTGEPNGGEATNQSAVYHVAPPSSVEFKRALTFTSLGGTTFYDESGLASMTLAWLQIQYLDEIGQKPSAIFVRGKFSGVSELNTMFWSGKFQNGVINATYQAQFKINGVIRNFKWRIQGAHT